MIKNLFIVLIVTIGIVSCNNDDDDPTTTNLVANKEFVFTLVSSQQECDDLISDGVNCTQSVNFDNNLNASVIVTDIVNGGEYKISGNTITITIQTSGDVENPMVFEANNDFTELARISNGSNDIWKIIEKVF